jgi:hypothetical protein
MEDDMKTILIIITVAVIQTVARAAGEPAWSLEGRSISPDSCGVACPCNIGGPPDNGECRFIQMRHVDMGRYGDVKIDGVRFAMGWRVHSQGGRRAAKFNFVAYYIDSCASAEQKEALRKLLSGPSFAGLGEPAELKEAALQLENLGAFGQVGKTASGTMGEIAKVEATPIGGGTNPENYRRTYEWSHEQQ